MVEAGKVEAASRQDKVNAYIAGTKAQLLEPNHETSGADGGVDETSSSGSELDDALDVKSMLQYLLRQQGRHEKRRVKHDGWFTLTIVRMEDRMGYLHELVAELQATIQNKIEAVWQQQMKEHGQLLDELSPASHDTSFDSSGSEP